MRPQTTIASHSLPHAIASAENGANTDIGTVSSPWPYVPVYFPDAVGKVVTRGGLAPWQRKKVAAYIEENLSSSIRIEQLAEIVRLSVSHFSRAFRLTFGHAPYGYILLRRMSYATDLMASTDAPLSQIALDCGMTDQAHFCKVFKKAYGTSPNRWRKPNRAIAAAQSANVLH